MDFPVTDEHVATVHPWTANSNSLHSPFTWMKQKNRLKRGLLNLTQQSARMSWLLMQLLLYQEQENPWYLLIVLWMVVLSHHKL
jgi:hypothetical protein